MKNRTETEEMIRKEQRRERSEDKNGSGQRAKPSIPTLAIDALIGEEEQNEIQKKQRPGSKANYPGPFGRLLRPSWTYSGPILKPPPLPPTGGI